MGGRELEKTQRRTRKKGSNRLCLTPPRNLPLLPEPKKARYELSSEDAAKKLGTPIDKGLTAAEACRQPAASEYGRNILKEEKEKPAWLRFLEQYKSYMQIVLVIAAVVSLIIHEYNTFVLLLLLTIFNAILSYHQEAKAAARSPPLTR